VRGTTERIPIHDTARHLAQWQRLKAALLDFVAEFERWPPRGSFTSS